MYDAKNVLIVFLISFCTLLLICTIYFYGPGRVTETKTVVETKYVNVNQPMTFKRIEQTLLNQGVATAWKDKIGGVTTDCFSTEILDDGRSIFSYCKLRKKLLRENE